MKTEWDYTTLADAFLKRPDYATEAIDILLEKAGCKKGDKVCDIGAGVAHLTIMLAEKGFNVSAVEPNDAMRENGINRTALFSNVSWSDGTGEHTAQQDKSFDLVTFGSSFNVCDRDAALRETARILKSGKWFACCWNHRQLNDPIQQEIESIIASHIKGYSYGTRREDQTDVINASGLFELAVYIEGTVKHQQTIADCIEAWRSHGTLARQARDKFDVIIQDIASFLNKLGRPVIDIPYQTRMWAAKLR